MIEVLASGPLTLVEDLGRRGLAASGIPRSGAADRGSLRLANRLVANPDDAAALEVTLGGLRLRFLDDHLVAITGAAVPASLSESQVGMRFSLLARAGALLELGTPVVGLRTYVAIRGGIDVPVVLGSRSTDVLSGLGPPRVRTGDRISVGEPVGAGPVVNSAPFVVTEGAHPIRFFPAARSEWILPATIADLARGRFTVGQESNRVAVRLEGDRLQRSNPDEYPSEGLVRGAIQVPPTGQPIVFLSDHPVTGGYPVVGVALADDVDRLAQLRPGESVQLAPLSQ